MSDNIKFFMRPIVPPSDDVLACWTIHADDRFGTQIGRRLERRANDWRMVFKDDKSVTVDTERDATILVNGLLLGRTLC